MKIILPCGVTAEEVMSKSLAARRIRSRPGRYVTVLAAAAMLSTTACATGTHGEFVWVEDYSAQSAPGADTYLIAVGDHLNIQVWDNEKLSTRAQVRSDGKLSFPLLNEIEVAGKAPKQVSQELERRLREANLVIAPRVNVAVEPSKLKVAVVGAVSRAGTYEIEPGGGVVEALASAGGLTEFAHRDRIYVVRLNPRPLRIRFSFDALTEVGRAALFRLQAGDRVIAE